MPLFVYQASAKEDMVVGQAMEIQEGGLLNSYSTTVRHGLIFRMPVSVMQSYNMFHVTLSFMQIS